MGSAMRRERGPPDEVRERGTNARSSPRPRIAKQNRSTEEPTRACGAMLYMPRLRAHDLAKRGEAQGGPRGCASKAGRTTRHVSSNQSKRLPKNHFISVMKRHYPN